MKSVAVSLIVVVSLASVAVWSFTEPLDDYLGVRCANCSAGHGVWVFMGTPYPSLTQIEFAGLVGIVLGLTLPLPRRYADGPVMFGVHTRYRQRAAPKQVSMSRLFKEGHAFGVFDRQATIALWMLFLVISTITALQAYGAYTTGTVHAQMAYLKKGNETMYVQQTLGPCQGRHCFWCWVARLETMNP